MSILLRKRVHKICECPNINLASAALPIPEFSLDPKFRSLCK